MRKAMGVGSTDLKSYRQPHKYVHDTGDVSLTDYVLFQRVAGPCKWPQSTFASQSHTLKWATKEGNGFRQATRTPKSWGQGDHLPPPPQKPSSGTAAPGNRLPFPQRRTHNLLPHTHQHTWARQALSCTKICKHTQINTLLHQCAQKHTHAL